MRHKLFTVVLAASSTDAFDGNGNVMALVNLLDSTTSTEYAYGPFAEPLQATGPMAKTNPLRFSTQYTDDVTGDLNYLFRPYSTRQGRWLSRDPVSEAGGFNIYAMVDNHSVASLDFLGLDIVCECAVEDYFKENGIKPNMWRKSGDNYTASPGYKGAGPASGVGEILWKMLQTSRVFKARDLQLAELKRHVTARQNVVKATQAVPWGAGNASGFNSQYWSDALGTVRQDAAAGVNDMFASKAAEEYSRGCKDTSRLILLKGILDTIGAAAFNAAIGTGGYIDVRATGAGLIREHTVPTQGKGEPPKNWVPGDLGYIQGLNPDHLFTGEWVVYLGGTEWWGHPTTVKTLDDWINTVENWEGADPSFKVHISGRRIFPGVGLDLE